MERWGRQTPEEGEGCHGWHVRDADGRGPWEGEGQHGRQGQGKNGRRQGQGEDGRGPWEGQHGKQGKGEQQGQRSRQEKNEDGQDPWEGEGPHDDHGTAKRQLRALDLFSGTGSVAKTLRRHGYQVVTVDNNPRRNADVKESILHWDYRSAYPVGYFDVVAASPPCTEYSTAMSRRRPRRLEEADALVAKAIEVIQHFKPRLWWVENPRWGLLRTRDVVQGLPYIDLDYCQFGLGGFRKATRFWCCTEIAKRPSVLCDFRTCRNLDKELEMKTGKARHLRAIGGRGRPSPPKDEVLQIPARLVEYLCNLDGGDDQDGKKKSKSKVRNEKVKGQQGGDWQVVKKCGVQTNNNQVREVQVRPWHVFPDRPFRVGRVEHRGGGTQLLMEVQARCNGEERIILALVDTGAQANLVRRGLFSSECFRPARVPLALTTVSGEVLPGGRSEIKLSLSFSAEADDGAPVQQRWKTTAWFHDADIGCDAILSYQWMSEARLNVLTWRDALQLNEPPRWILQSTGPERRNTECEISTIDTTPLGKIAPSKKDNNEDVMKEEDDALEKAIRINRVRMMQLRLGEEIDLETGEVEEEPLTDEDLWEAAKLLEQMKASERRVNGMMVIEDEVESPLAEELRAGIMREYKDRVFRDRVWPRPPVRGQHGAAKLYLKPGAKPVCGRTISLSGERLAAMRELEADWKTDDKLEPGCGPWRAAAFPIRKKNNKWRGVVDYNRTNQEIQDDSYPLPRIPEIQVQQGGCHLFSVVDLKDAFHQVHLHPESRPITSTQLPGGLFQWTVVPQGIKVGPPLLQRDIDATCASVSNIARPYFDDICIGTRKEEGMTEEDLLRKHDEDVRKVFDRLAADKWVVDPKKCTLFAKRVEFCGHVMGEGIIKPSPGKLLAVQRFEPPPTVTALRGFLGLCNYYSTYVKMYAEYAAPLQEKLKVPKDDAKAGSKAKVHWSAEDIKAFERLKGALVEGLELFHLDTSKPFVLRTDASDYAIGAVLEQFPDVQGMPTIQDLSKPGAARAVAFMSRKLTKGQSTRWDTRDKETYAIVSALEKWASWIGFQPILVLTDHKTLESWHKEAFSAATGPTGRRARWHALMNMFDLQVVYTPGKGHIVPDTLSRWAYPASRAWADVSRHGNAEDAQEMKKIILEERKEERESAQVAEVHGTPPLGKCIAVLSQKPSGPSGQTISGVTTRGGAKTGDRGSSVQRPPGLNASSPRGPTQTPKGEALDAYGNCLDVAPRQPMAWRPKRSSSLPLPSNNEDNMENEHGGRGQSVEMNSEEQVQDKSPRGRSRTRRGKSQEVEVEDANVETNPHPPIPGGGLAPRVPLQGERAQGPPEGERDGRKTILDEDWVEEYEACTRWSTVWRAVHQPAAEWPHGYQLVQNKLIYGGRWCIPMGLTGKVLRAHHSIAGHVGGDKLWQEAGKHYVFAWPNEAYGLAQHMIRLCEVCQACEHPHVSLRLPIQPTPIPPTIMTSVAIDIFQMPKVTWEGVEYDAFAACVDRHSGWVVATPHKLRGLTAAKVAKSMYESWWSPHGVPAILTSDRGAHFAGAWWRTMCASLGIRQAYAQAYHHPANGRAEVVGAQLQKRLRKLQAEEGTCWVPALQRAVRQLHDVPGPSGLSPYQVLYGRDRPYAGVPYEPPHVWPDAVAFFEKQRDIDEKVSRVLNDLHTERARQVNEDRRDLSVLVPDQKVWWLRPRGRSGEKLETYWVGPCRVVQRVGEHSYVVETRLGHHVDVHRCHLKPHVEDVHSGRPLALFQFKQAAPEMDLAVDEWVVDKITGHRHNAAGDLEFRVRWMGSEEDTWEPVGHFFQRYAVDFIAYCREKGLQVDVIDHLARHPSETAALWGSPTTVCIVHALVAPQQPEAELRWEEPPEDWPAENETGPEGHAYPSENPDSLLHTSSDAPCSIIPAHDACTPPSSFFSQMHPGHVCLPLMARPGGARPTCRRAGE